MQIRYSLACTAEFLQLLGMISYAFKTILFFSTFKEKFQFGLIHHFRQLTQTKVIPI